MTTRRDFTKLLGLGALTIVVPQFGRFYRESAGRVFTPSNDPLHLKVYSLGFTVTEEMLRSDLYFPNLSLAMARAQKEVPHRPVVIELQAGGTWNVGARQAVLEHHWNAPNKYWITVKPENYPNLRTRPRFVSGP